MRGLQSDIATLVLCLLMCNAKAFQSGFSQAPTKNQHMVQPFRQHAAKATRLGMAYVPPSNAVVPKKEKKLLLPKVGDIIRFYDLDGGKSKGQVLVGRISFISSIIGSEKAWVADITELEDVGDGYYAEYPSRKRLSRKSQRSLYDISPLSGSFVRSENAYKVPCERETMLPIVRSEQYDLDGYSGPVPGIVNDKIVEEDSVAYNTLKGQLLKYTLLVGLAGTVAVDLAKGTEDAVIYAGGVAASLAYLFLLSVKTDTIAEPDRKFGNNVSNLRFLMPVFLLTTVAIYNKLQGNPSSIAPSNNSPFQTVTSEQFGAAIVGFLTYRVPLFLGQIKDAFKDEDGDVSAPGSLGVAMKLSSDGKQEVDALPNDLTQTPLLLVSGPQATGRASLVERLIKESNGQFVKPAQLDRMKDEATFERLKKRDELIQIDDTGRFAITKDAILEMTESDAGSKVVTVFDADVSVAKRVAALPGIKVIGVWVGLNSLKKFEERLRAQIDAGEIAVTDDETVDSVVRARLSDIVGEIEYGISAGLFEFTIISQDEELALQELRQAADYCLK